MKLGHVFLVGAGPGDPELLTIKGLEALRQADYVLYDRLIHPAILGFAPEQAVREYVGKEVGTPSAPRQAAINHRLVELGLAGFKVVRLKGGDPFVFGRGSEEAEELHKAKVPFTVIPGISSSIAGPGAAGIPVTHRGLASTFSVFAGREGEQNSLDDSHWQLAADSPTSIFLMGVEQLPLIVARLIEKGKGIATPIAIIANATLPEQQTVVGTLGDIVDRALDIRPPAVIIVGPTVNVRQALFSGDYPC